MPKRMRIFSDETFLIAVNLKMRKVFKYNLKPVEQISGRVIDCFAVKHNHERNTRYHHVDEKRHRYKHERDRYVAILFRHCRHSVL